MKTLFYSCWNTLSLPQKAFEILPSLRIYYQNDGFYTFGEYDNEYCKQLDMQFAFLIVSFQISFYWSFYEQKL